MDGGHQSLHDAEVVVQHLISLIRSFDNEIIHSGRSFANVVILIHQSFVR